MTPSLNGSMAGLPTRASWNAASRYSIVGAISIEPVRCSAIPELGLAVKLGSSDSATLTFTTPLRVLKCSMSLTKSSGSSDGERCSRKAIFGCSVVTTSGAVISSPFARTTPRT